MIYDNICSLCHQRGITISGLEKALNIGNGTISGWKKSSPRVDKLVLVANYFGVSVDEIINCTD